MKDADGHPPGSENYDSRTIRIPPSAWKNFNQLETRYWKFKQNLWHTILLFKSNKKYYLFGEDASKARFFDEINVLNEGGAFYAIAESQVKLLEERLVDAYERVAVVEPEERPGSDTTADRLTRISTLGTFEKSSMIEDVENYCLSVKETMVGCQIRQFGVAFFNAAIGHIALARFTDDDQLTVLATLLTQIRPIELVVETSLSTEVRATLRNKCPPAVLWNDRKPEEEFWTAERTIQELASQGYIQDQEPSVLSLAKSDELTMSALGGLIDYLATLHFDWKTISPSHYSWYEPLGGNSRLLLPSSTLTSLGVLRNPSEGDRGTLLSFLNRCVTPAGKRLFKQWVLHPSNDCEKINRRLDAVDVINRDNACLKEMIRHLQQLGPVELGIRRIRAGTAKPEILIHVLERLETATVAVELIGKLGWRCKLLGDLQDSVPNVAADWKSWRSQIDYAATLQDKVLRLRTGVDKAYDDIRVNIKHAEKQMQDFLCLVNRKYKKPRFRNAYFVAGRNAELRIFGVKLDRIPSERIKLGSTRSTGTHFHVPALVGPSHELEEALTAESDLMPNLNARFYKQFSSQSRNYLILVGIAAHIDCLCSLARVSGSLQRPCCRPIMLKTGKGTLKFDQLRYPPLAPKMENFVPNDINLGGSSANMILLTGPHSSGKSSIMRLTCLAVIMAHIGCYLPCKAAHITPVDRILTRHGAVDSIMTSQSTFQVECSETQTILTDGSPRSLVIVDELGRGTSAIDGLAIASATLHHLATHVRCMGFFATHYFSLTEDYKKHPEISNKQMALRFEDQKPVFLYKLQDGTTADSHGLMCARSAGLNLWIIEQATKQASTARKKPYSKDVIPFGLRMEVSAMIRDEGEESSLQSLNVLRSWIAALSEDCETTAN